MSNGWLDGVGTVAGILLGVAIPAQEAMRARKAIGALLTERIRETTDAFDAAQALAHQALSALSGPARERADFAAAYNRSYIEHILRRVEAVTNDALIHVPEGGTAFVDAASHAQTSTRDFFDNLMAVNVSTPSLHALRFLFDRLTTDLRELHAEGDHMLQMRRAGVSAVSTCRAFWNLR